MKLSLGSLVLFFATAAFGAPIPSPAPSIYRSLTPSTLQVLSSLVEEAHPEKPGLIPVAFFSYLFILYFACYFLRYWLWPLMVGSKKWSSLRNDIQKTMVIYALQVFITSLVLVIQLTASPVLKLNFTLWRVELVRVSANLIAGLYSVELLYRERMRLPMVAHHFLTIFVMSFIVVMLDRTHDPSFLLSGLIWIFQATTEQLTFIALAGYRLKWPAHRVCLLLRFSAIQSLICKVAAITGSIYIWAQWQSSNTSSYGIANSIVVWIVTVGLAITQVWGSWVVWKIGDSLEERYRDQEKTEEACGANLPRATSIIEVLQEKNKGSSLTPADSIFTGPNSSSSTSVGVAS